MIGTALLMLPFSTASGDDAPFVSALFTATSCVCVTGLAVVDTGTYWSPFGQVVMLLLIQVGGLGIMTLASIGLVLLGRRIGLRQSVLGAADKGQSGLAFVKRLAKLVAILTLTFEAHRHAHLRDPDVRLVRLLGLEVVLVRPVPLRVGLQQRRLRAAADEHHAMGRRTGP